MLIQYSKLIVLENVDGVTTMIFIIEEVHESISDISQRTVRVLQIHFVLNFKCKIV